MKEQFFEGNPEDAVADEKIKKFYLGSDILDYSNDKYKNTKRPQRKC